MMGERRVAQDALVYEFSLERHVPQDHLLRKIDRVVEFGGVRAHLAPFYSETGRPSVCPELMIRMLLIGYCFGIRSERRICEEVHLNLAYRWFWHGRFRESSLFRHLFDEVLRRRMAEGLVGGEGFAVDASMIEADADRRKGGPASEGLPEGRTSRAIEEYLATLNGAAFGAASNVTPNFLSPSDPAARWSGAHGGPAFCAYSLNYLIDVDNAVIVGVEERPQSARLRRRRQSA